jgi:hypothetical protein
MRASEILTKARALIANKEHWCQGAYAMRADGEYADPSGPDAVRWCALGACIKVAVGIGGELDVASGLLHRACYGSRRQSVLLTNDKAGHAAVMRLYDKAIKMAIKQEKEIAESI